MMDPFVKYFLVWTIIGIAGTANSMIGLNACFEKKRSTIPVIIYFLLKSTVVSWLTAAVIYRPEIPWVGTAMLILSVFTAVFNFYMLWFTWKGDPLKIAVAGIVSDTISGISIIAGAALMNLLHGQPLSIDFVSLGIADAFAAGIVSVSLYGLAIKILSRAIAFLRSLEIRHRRSTTLIIIAAITMLSCGNISSREKIDNAFASACILCLIFLIPMLILMIRRLRTNFTRKALLRSRSEMTEAFIMAVNNQSAMVGEQRKTLDAIKESIKTTGEHALNDEMRKYLDRLRAHADALSGGTYSGSLAVDAVLTMYAARFRRRGWSTDFRVSDISGSEKETSDISMILLNWAEEVPDSRDAEDGYTIRYEIMCSGNQQIIELDIPQTGRRRFPKERLREYTGKDGIIEEKSLGGRLILSVMREVAVS